VPLRRERADLILAVRLTPRAARERIGGLFRDADGRRWLQASVTAPPDKGKANAALIALLARTFKLPASSILLETGDTSRLKRLRLLDCTPAAEQTLTQYLSEERNEQ
jgi:uncharacterized protein (TIGR00251 family)